MPVQNPAQADRQSTATKPRHEATIAASTGFAEWLARHRIRLAFSAYQANRLLLVGRHCDGQLAVNERL